MSWSENRREYLDKKYAANDGESDTPRVKGSQRHAPKKANHKHIYHNCVFQEKSKYFQKDFYHLGSYCEICGKKGSFDHKQPGAEKIYTCLYLDNETLEKAKENYPTFETTWDDKYVSKPE